MRIRRRDRDPAEAAGANESRTGPYDYDQEGARVADPAGPLTDRGAADAAPTGDAPTGDPASAQVETATSPPVTDGGSTSAEPAAPQATASASAEPTVSTQEVAETAVAAREVVEAVSPAAEPGAPSASEPVPTPTEGAPTGPAVTPRDDPEPMAVAVAADASVVAPAPPAAKPASPVAKHAMRAPSIGDEATELLNGSKPAPRELPRIIAIANQKGGVGKTTTTVNLGAALAELDYRVLVIDLDPQGNATTGLGVEARNFELSMYDVIMRDQPLEDCIEPTSVKNLFVAPATIDLAGVEIELVPAFSRELKLKRAIDTVVDDFDFVLIDCPPSLGLITVNGLAAADEVLVPIQCEYYALEGLSQLLRNVNLVSTNLNQTLEVSTIVLTMFDARTRLSVDVANEVREHFSGRVCRAVIPRTVRLSEAPSFGQPITVFDPASRGAVAYRELAKEVSNGAPQRSR